MASRVATATVVALVLFAGARASAAPRCLKYEPEVVALVGVVREQTFPGPPNYESVTKGDKPERYWVLHLERPICVEPSDPSDDLQPAEGSVKTLQIMIPDYDAWRTLLGREVRITGTLMHAISAHHHTAVLIQATKIEQPR